MLKKAKNDAWSAIDLNTQYHKNGQGTESPLKCAQMAHREKQQFVFQPADINANVSILSGII